MRQNVAEGNMVSRDHEKHLLLGEQILPLRVDPLEKKGKNALLLLLKEFPFTSSTEGTMLKPAARGLLQASLLIFSIIITVIFSAVLDKENTKNYTLLLFEYHSISIGVDEISFFYTVRTRTQEN